MTDEPLRPLIGVTTSEMRQAQLVNRRPEGEPVAHEMALGLTYLRAIESAGGIPLVLAPLELAFVPPLLERVDGICLSGGPDVRPNRASIYSSSRSPRRHPNAECRSSRSAAGCRC